ncbi:MAG: AAA family ATPase [Clostridia bacterium]|nr:AAA family ATPase [Clostridia bacterium]
MKVENKNLNIPNINVNTLVDKLTRLYSNVIKSGAPLWDIEQTPFLWGPAGIGKSQAIFQFAKKLQSETGKRVVVTDVRILLFSPLDLRGIPVADVEKQLAIWLKPKIFDMDPGEECVNILFLDELSTAPHTVQQAAYQICLDRQVGEHKLPENCIVIAAGNRTTDQGVSYKMSKPLCNRFMHFNVETNYMVWVKWAIAHEMDSRIVGYLAFDNSKLNIEPDTSEKAFPTPRSWSFVNNILKYSDGNLKEDMDFIGGCIGMDTAHEFATWVRTNADLPKISEIFAGYCSKYPSSYDALSALTASLVYAIRGNRDSITANELENVCAYVSRFPSDYQMLFYTDLKNIKEIASVLTQCPSRQIWMNKNKKFFLR